MNLQDRPGRRFPVISVSVKSFLSTLLSFASVLTLGDLPVAATAAAAPSSAPAPSPAKDKKHKQDPA
jgi:hypothetical protein